MRALDVITEMAEDPKHFLKRVALPTQFTVDSKWEDWTVDGQGNVMAHGEAKSAGRPHWRNVKKFDVEGYKKRTGNYPTGVINIYDISYWQHDGSKITSPYEMRSCMGGPPRRRQQEGADALQTAMRQATAEILADDNTAMFGGGREDGRRAADAYDINCGMCEEWANRVAELCPEAEAVGVGNLTGNADDDLEYPHVFIRYQGKFYDCECSAGVRDWKQLPLFTRVHEAEDPKKLFREMPRRHDIAAFSGDWVTDREGNVVAFTPDYNTHDDQEAKDIAHYESIVKFDFNEYKAYWGDLPSGMDISDVAYWTNDGTYHKADEQYRQDIKTGGIAR